MTKPKSTEAQSPSGLLDAPGGKPVPAGRSRAPAAQSRKRCDVSGGGSMQLSLRPKMR